MVRAAFLLALISAGAVAAPVPPPSEKELLAKHWGKTEGNGEFELKGKQLTIRTATQPSKGLIGIISGGDTARVTMPRATRTVAGDFDIAVTITDAAPPNKDAKHEGAYPDTRAGLLVEGGGYAIEFHLRQFHPKVQGVKDEPTRCVFLDTWYPRGGSGSQLKTAEDGKSVHLRATRKDKALVVSYSFDGAEWSTPHAPRQALDFPDEVTVGVFFAHSTFQTLGATFDKFTVEKPKVELGKEK
jgi:hypothetical protein